MVPFRRAFCGREPANGTRDSPDSPDVGRVTLRGQASSIPHLWRHTTNLGAGWVGAAAEAVTDGLGLQRLAVRAPPPTLRAGHPLRQCPVGDFHEEAIIIHSLFEKPTGSGRLEFSR